MIVNKRRLKWLVTDSGHITEAKGNQLDILIDEQAAYSANREEGEICWPH